VLTEVNDAARASTMVERHARTAPRGAALAARAMQGAAMSIREFCVRDVICATRTATITQVAALMREHHVGDVIVTDDVGGRRIPVGILTDRDIVVEVIAADVDPRGLAVGDLLLRPLVTVREDKSYADTVRLMSEHGVRRLPVVDAEGALLGIITIDDILRQLAAPLAAIGELPRRERHMEMRLRR
jgi:CBS domain-containing protein